MKSMYLLFFVFAQLLFPFLPMHAQLFPSESYLPVFENGKNGCKHRVTGKVVLPPIYDGVEVYEKGIVAKKNEKYGFFNFQGNLQLSIEYDKIEYAYDILICKKGNFVEIRRFDGSFFTKEKFEDFKMYEKKIVAVKKGSRWIYGVRYPDGKIDFHKEFESIATFCLDPRNTWFKVGHPGGGFIITDSLFNRISRRIYEEIETRGCARGYFTYKVNGLWGLMNHNLVEVCDPIYERMEEFGSSEFLLVQKNGLYGLIDGNANILFPAVFEKIKENVQAGGRELAYFKKNGLYGMLNYYTKDIFFPVEYTTIRPTPYYYCVTDKNGKKGLFNLRGVAILPIEFDEIEEYPIDKKPCIIAKSGKYGLFMADKIVVPLEYDKIERVFVSNLNTYLFLVTKDKKQSWVNYDGKFLNGIFYEEVHHFKGGYSMVNKNGEWISLDVRGNEHTETPIEDEDIIPGRKKDK